MKKRSPSQSALINPRVGIALTLCLIGVSLVVASIAAPAGPSGAQSADSSFAVTPTVITSVANGVSGSVRDLPAGLSTVRTFVERELPPVKAPRDVPAGFVDQVLQSAFATIAMPTTNVSFEGINQEEGCGGCVPPDTTGAVGPSQYVQMTNSAFSVYAKNGTRLSGPSPINQLFQSFPKGNVCRETNNGDPIVVYDQLADRWL